MTFYSALLPLTLFLEWFWFLVLFCFLLNRNFLTWDLLLSLGKWRTLFWILQGAFMAICFHFYFILSCLDFFQPSVTMRRFSFQEYWEFDLLICLFFCFVVFFSPKVPLSWKGHFFLLSIFRSFYHEEEQEGIHSAMDFHVLNMISGSCSYFLCRAQFSVSPEAWGRGPSRRRLILLALSLLREINAFCNIWRMPCTPLAERQKSLPGGLCALK